MAEPAIRVENLSKRYKIGAQPRQDTLRDAFTEGLKGLARRKSGEREDTLLWALREVSFEIQRGEAVGIIGRNGAGKSTLLKILSQITEPTSGRAVINGRVGSLLEVGTGFHPELTGRENIYLYGAILGMRREEILGKFDEIVAFAEIERFLDTPVKRYSSGMYVRLAFAVAAHLEPEILLVDEVLAVGDTLFQKKCLGKMSRVADDGKTVVFVSHQLAAIQGLCNRCLLIQNGNLAWDDIPANTISRYLADISEAIKSSNLARATNRRGSQSITFTNFYVTDIHGNPLTTILSGEDVFFVFEYSTASEKLIKNLSIGFSLHSQQLQTIFGIYNDYSNKVFENVPTGNGKIKFLLKRFPITPGNYIVHARMVANGVEADWPLDGVGTISVALGDFYKTGSLGYRDNNSIFYIDGEWSIDENL